MGYKKKLPNEKLDCITNTEWDLTKRLWDLEQEGQKMGSKTNTVP